MPSIAEIRQQAGGAYDDMSDQQLGDAIYKKFYSDMPRADFDAKLGLTQQKTSESKPAYDTADVAKSAGIGAVRGGIGLAGLPGDLRELAASGASKLTGVPAERFSGAFKYVPMLGGPTSGQITSGVEGVTGPLYKPQTTAGEYAQTAGEFLPAAIGPGGLAARAARVAIPAAASETAGQATKGTELEPYARAAAGFAAPVAMAGARRLATPLPAASAERQAAVQTLRGEGVEPTAGQVTGSRPLQWFEQTLGDLPGAGRASSGATERVAEQFTSAALRRAGENAERATPEVIDRAFTRIGNDFEGLAARNTFRPDRQFGREARDAIDEYRSLVSPPNRAPLIENFEAEIATQLARGGGMIQGATYQSLSSRLERAARNNASQPEVARTLRDLRAALNDGMERSLARSMSPDLGAWRQARNEYRNMLVIEKAATNANEGLITPAALHRAANSIGGRGYRRGNNDFSDLVHAGRDVLQTLPQSGTAPRTFAQNAPAVIGGGIGALFAGMPGAALGAAAALAGPPLMGRALMSPLGQAYFGNQLMAAPAQGLGRRAITGGLLGGLPAVQ